MDVRPSSTCGSVSAARSRLFGCLAAAALLCLVLSTSRAGAAPSATVVVTNPDFATLAVDAAGTGWGQPVGSSTQLWKTTDEGAHWTQDTGWSSIGRRVWYVTPLASGAVLAAYDTGMNYAVARSSDGGATWKTVLMLPCFVPDCSVRYTTLGPRSIVQGDGFVYLGTYSNSPPATNTNYLYRSSDDGQTWSVVNTSTQFRHIHGLAFDPLTHRLFVFFGDSEGMATWYTDDHGATLKPLCTAYSCTMINAMTDPQGSGAIIGGTDNPGRTNQVIKIDSAGTVTSLFSMPYVSYSSTRVGNTLLVAETHEPGTITDPHIELFGSSDGGATWASLYSFTIPSSAGSYEMDVNAVYPNGDVAVQVVGQGTVVLRLAGGGGGGGGGSVPVVVSAPVVSGSAQVGQTLSASTGTWSGSPTSYAYQWRRCDQSGSSCSNIGSATSSSYLLASADLGSTLRVRVTASNATGASAPADSAATAAVTTASGGGSGSGSGGGGGGGGSGTFGATAPGGSSGAPGAGYKFGGPFALGSAGTATTFEFYARGGGAAQTFVPAIYTSTGSAPGSLVVAGPAVTVAAGQAAGWVSVTLPSTSLAAGTYYLVLQSRDASNQASIYYDGAQTNEGVYNVDTGSTPSSSFGSADTEPRHWSYRVTVG